MYNNYMYSAMLNWSYKYSLPAPMSLPKNACPGFQGQKSHTQHLPLYF